MDNALFKSFMRQNFSIVEMDNTLIVRVVYKTKL